ncbi:PucR family transcriptional regulator [Trujillonella endophytica]|uniref:PucR family transcriptional regulator n=1 Tax=Trujillonella endophytica TaxID=673521 RepID=UPI001B8CE25F|nr:PucR family transcriptional regulator [Trujillella endophytica]
MAEDDSPFPPHVVTALTEQLPAVAESTIATIVVEVPSYAGAFSGDMGRTIERAVQVALGGFLNLATGGGDPSRPIGPALDGAYALGRGEARSGRSMDALLAAFRVGARVSWRHMSGAAVAAGMSAEGLARFAELVFAYIDQLSASSVAGHADELASTGRARRRHLERLAAVLVAGRPLHDLTAAAERAEWLPPRTLTAVLLPETHARAVLSTLDVRTLVSAEELPAGDLPGPERVALLVPDAEGRGRGPLLAALQGKDAVVGPPRSWTAAQASYARAQRAVQLGLRAEGTAPLDTEERLAELVLRADATALADLRTRVLAPLDRVGATAREKLVETLRSWLLHHGRRDRVAAELFVHPQTVRYRMGQLRDLFGDRLDDPRTVLELTVALAVPAT